MILLNRGGTFAWFGAENVAFANVDALVRAGEPTPTVRFDDVFLT
jgi:hypothetical protein